MSDIVTNPDDYLFVTEVGSRMWGMAKFASDYDLFHVYQTPSKDYLVSGNFGSTKPAKSWVDEKNREIDAQYMEIGHLVNLLKKGNINAMWAVCSRVVHKDSEVLQQLKYITLQNLSKASYPSICGMAISQLKDAEKRKEVRDPQKSLWSCKRTLEFGHTLLTGGGVFLQCNSGYEMTEEILQKEFDRLDEAHKMSKLPDAPNPKHFDNFIYRLRMKEILDNNIVVKVCDK
jgi:predicted nucleotidyltransferase